MIVTDLVSFAPRSPARETLPVVKDGCVEKRAVEFGDQLHPTRFLPGDRFTIAAELGADYVLATHASGRTVLIDRADLAPIE
jgi:hypothetical protein